MRNKEKQHWNTGITLNMRPDILLGQRLIVVNISGFPFTEHKIVQLSVKNKECKAKHSHFAKSEM